MSYDIEELILEVSAEHSIWNIKANEYHDRVAKHVSWMKIAKIVFKDFEKLDETEKQKKIILIQRKWKNLKDTYRKKCITKSGQAANKIKKYIYSDILEFLRPTMENRNTEGNFDEDNDSSNENEDYAEDEEQETEEVEKGAEEENSMKTPEVKVVTPRLGTLKSKKYDDKKMSHFESQLVDFLKTKQSDDDPDKSFLMSLLPTLKSLNEDQKVTVQIEMLNIFRKIKNPQPPSPYSHAQNPSDSHPTYTQTYSNYSQNNSSLQYSQNRHSSYDSQIDLNRNYTNL